jgi:hypothetical protein
MDVGEELGTVLGLAETVGVMLGEGEGASDGMEFVVGAAVLTLLLLFLLLRLFMTRLRYDLSSFLEPPFDFVTLI